MADYTTNVPFGIETNSHDMARYQFDSFIRNMYASLPVRVVAVQATGLAPVGYVNLKVLLKQRNSNNEFTDYPLIHNAPYFRLQGGENAVIIDPEIGDIGIAGFSSRDASAVNRNRGEAVTPSYRRFDLADAWYIGGILNKTPKQYIIFNQSGIKVYSPANVTVEAPQVVVNASSSMTINTPALTVTGQITANQGINASGDITAGAISVSTHVHPDAHGGDTGQPK